MSDETDLAPTSDAPEGEPHSSGDDRWDSVFGPSGAYEAARAERGNGASWKTGANIVLAFAILLLIPGVVVFLNTKGGVSVALIGGVILALGRWFDARPSLPRNSRRVTTAATA